MLAQEIIRRKRDGQALDRAQIDAFVAGLVDASWSEAQVAAMAMAMFMNGLSHAETIALTHAMTRSGDVLDWADAKLGGPVLDKHSTGGVGDKVSLLLAPIVAACGGFVPMISGRGLGHTGGTLDKLDSIAGYCTAASGAQLRAALRSAGCAIVGQTATLAPADRRLYAIRDVTATVESIPLITASILSKKLAAGLQGLVIDVKLGNGAFATGLPMARALARSLVQVAGGAGLPTRACLSDMNEVLGHSCGNAVEVHEALAFLQGTRREPRLLELTRRLSAELVLLGGLASHMDGALARVDAVLADGRALERFARMVAALGGPLDFVERAAGYLPAAPAQRVLRAPRAGWVGAMATREIGLLVVELGGGRRQASDAVDHRVGLSEIVAIGRRVAAGDALAIVHAADEASAAAGCERLAALIEIADAAPAPRAVVIECTDEVAP
ncbi:MAG TPA: thymidine phosphorylase [Burkholderiaceae bacterium]|nr:thymidine phosphorylase [Burkholderiaceae bacterium]